MKYSQRKEELFLPFSYMDIFFILLAVLALSFGIYDVAERHEKNKGAIYQVELSACVEKALKQSIPEAGDVFLEDDKAAGEVLSVEIKETAEVFQVKAVCKKIGTPPKTGEEIKLETATGICTMLVESVEKCTSEEGRYLQ